MSNDHVHNWHLIKTQDLPDDPNLTLKIEQCAWCGERREYRDTGHYDQA